MDCTSILDGYDGIGESGPTMVVPVVGLKKCLWHLPSSLEGACKRKHIYYGFSIYP